MILSPDRIIARIRLCNRYRRRSLTLLGLASPSGALPFPWPHDAHIVRVEQLRQLRKMQQRQGLVECDRIASAIEQDHRAMIA
jgi:hypothetical protein